MFDCVFTFDGARCHYIIECVRREKNGKWCSMYIGFGSVQSAKNVLEHAKSARAPLAMAKIWTFFGFYHCNMTTWKLHRHWMKPWTSADVCERTMNLLNHWVVVMRPNVERTHYFRWAASVDMSTIIWSRQNRRAISCPTSWMKQITFDTGISECLYFDRCVFFSLLFHHLGALGTVYQNI